jgi:hypothetical protein
MKIKISFSCLLLFLQVLVYSQKKLNIAVSPSYSTRGFLLELHDYPTRTHRYGYTNNFARQFDVKNFGLDFSSTFLKEKLTLQLSSYFRYGFLYYDKDLKIEKKRFEADLIADFFYNFKKKHPWSFGFYVGAGIGK